MLKWLEYNPFRHRQSSELSIKMLSFKHSKVEIVILGLKHYRKDPSRGITVIIVRVKSSLSANELTGRNDHTNNVLLEFYYIKLNMQKKRCLVLYLINYY